MAAADKKPFWRWKTAWEHLNFVHWISEITEHDLGKEVLSGARNLRCTVEAATFEGFRLVVKEVDDSVRDFWREVRVQHRDFGREATLGAG